MHEIRVLSGEAVGALIDPVQVLAGVENAYKWKAEGKSNEFPLVFHDFSPKQADMDIKSGHVAPTGRFGLKAVAFFGDNPSRGLPALTSTMALFDDSTGEPVAFLNAEAITGYRTAAAAAVGAKALGRGDSKTLAVVGCGHLCPYIVGMMSLAFPGLECTAVVSPLAPEDAAAVVAGLPQTLAGLGFATDTAVEYVAAPSVEEAVRRADLVVTATPATAPVVDAAWVRPGTHFSCLGADMAGKQELDPRILARAVVLVDDMAQCKAVGEIEVGLAAGAFGEDTIAGEIGQVLTGDVPGRMNDEQITVFDSTGIAAQDLVAAASVLAAAESANAGATVAW